MRVDGLGQNRSKWALVEKVTHEDVRKYARIHPKYARCRSNLARACSGSRNKGDLAVTWRICPGRKDVPFLQGTVGEPATTGPEIGNDSGWFGVMLQEDQESEP